MNWTSALPVALAILSAAVIFRRQVVWRLGAYGRVLAMPMAFLVWLAFLSFGQFWGTIGGMAWAAAAPLMIGGLIAATRYDRSRLRPLRWTAIDRLSFAGMALLIFSHGGNDNIWHYSIVNTFLRGNIPPCSFNDPGRALPYHTLFDAAAAVVAHAFGLSPERALDVITLTSVLMTMACLQAVSRIVFADRWSQQAARVLFLAGFGPLFLSWVIGPGDGRYFFQGQTTQAFVVAIFRRPVGLGYVLFLFLLAVVLPRIGSRWGRPHGGKSPHAAWLIPCGFLMPQTAEELLPISAVLLAILLYSRAISLRWVLAFAASVLFSVPVSPLLRTSMPADAAGAGALELSWPPTLPRWDRGYHRDGLPLHSIESIWVAVVEWGPIFFGALILSVADARRRTIAAVFVTGLAIACALRYHDSKIYLDRFLFYGTSAGFMLAAAWFERGRRVGATAASRWIHGAAGVLFIVLPTLAASGLFAARHISRAVTFRFPQPFLPLAPDELRAKLSVVGPREQILTDQRYAQSLVLSGFIVDAPVVTPEVVMVIEDELPAHLNRTDLDPDWLLLPADHPRVVGRPATAEHDGYVLVRNP